MIEKEKKDLFDGHSQISVVYSSSEIVIKKVIEPCVRGYG